MYKLFYIVIRSNDTHPLFYESPDFLPYRAAIEEARFELSHIFSQVVYTDGSIPNSKVQLLAFKTKEDWMSFKIKVNQKLSFGTNESHNNAIEKGIAEYCTEKGHLLMIKIHEDDNLVYRKKLVDMPDAGILPAVHSI